MEIKLILTELHFFKLVNLGCFLHCRVWSLCNQFIPPFAMNLFQTLHTCWGYIGDVHVGF